MKLFLHFLLPLALLAGCGSTRPIASPAAPTADDLRWIDTLRELDERSDVLLGMANFQSQRKELKDFADAAAREHRERSTGIGEWRDSAFAGTAKNVALPACGERDYRSLGQPSTDLQIVDRLIDHRECALEFARRAVTAIHAANARHLADEAVRDYEGELQWLRSLRSAWQ